MIIPSKLKVGGHIYDVTVGYVFTERSDLCGQAHHATRKIRVMTTTSEGESRPRSCIEETFFHELLHCVDEVFNARGLKEEELTRLSEGLYAVLSLNGLLKEDSQTL